MVSHGRVLQSQRSGGGAASLVPLILLTIFIGRGIFTFATAYLNNWIMSRVLNDLRRNLSLINSFMEEACRKTAARYGIDLDAALITTIDPPSDVDEALASINTTQNQVAASISQAA